MISILFENEQTADPSRLPPFEVVCYEFKENTFTATLIPIRQPESWFSFLLSSLRRRFPSLDEGSGVVGGA